MLTRNRFIPIHYLEDSHTVYRSCMRCISSRLGEVNGFISLVRWIMSREFGCKRVAWDFWCVCPPRSLISLLLLFGSSSWLCFLLSVIYSLFIWCLKSDPASDLSEFAFQAQSTKLCLSAGDLAQIFLLGPGSQADERSLDACISARRS